jgi:hypothetical protein
VGDKAAESCVVGVDVGMQKFCEKVGLLVWCGGGCSGSGIAVAALLFELDSIGPCFQGAKE